MVRREGVEEMRGIQAAIEVSSEVGLAVVTASTAAFVALWHWATKKDARHIQSLEKQNATILATTNAHSVELRELLSAHIASERAMTGAVQELTHVMERVHDKLDRAG